MDYTPIIRELQAQVDKLQMTIETLRSLGDGVAPTKRPYTRRKFRMSADARARIAAAQRARWAKLRK